MRRLFSVGLLIAIIVLPTSIFAKSYTIQEGETLYGVTMREWDWHLHVLDMLEDVNPGIDIDNIRPGQVVEIPEHPLAEPVMPFEEVDHLRELERELSNTKDQLTACSSTVDVLEGSFTSEGSRIGELEEELQAVRDALRVKSSEVADLAGVEAELRARIHALENPVPEEPEDISRTGATIIVGIFVVILLEAGVLIWRANRR